MRVIPSGPTKLTIPTLPKVDKEYILVGGVITTSYTATCYVWNYSVAFPITEKPKTLEDFKSLDGEIKLDLENHNAVLSLSSLGSIHKGFIQTYFKQVQNGILPSSKSLAGWIKSKNRKLKSNDELLVIKFLLDIQQSGFSLPNIYDDPLLNKIFMAYFKMSAPQNGDFNQTCLFLGIQSDKSKLKFASEIFNKLKVDNGLALSISSLGENFRGFIYFLPKLKEEALNYLIEQEHVRESTNESVEPILETSNIGICVSEVKEVGLSFEAPKDRIIGFKCELLDELEIDYKKGIPSQHYIATIYTAVGNSNKRARLHDAFHNFNMKHILSVEIDYSDGRGLKLFLPVAVCKEIINDLNESSQSSYNLSQWIKQT